MKMMENSLFLAIFTDKKTCNKNDVLRNRIIFLIKVEIFDYSLSQPETVKLTESGGKFTIYSKIYWQKNIPKMQQKMIY